MPVKTGISVIFKQEHQNLFQYVYGKSTNATKKESACCYADAPDSIFFIILPTTTLTLYIAFLLCFYPSFSKKSRRRGLITITYIRIKRLITKNRSARLRNKNLIYS